MPRIQAFKSTNLLADKKRSKEYVKHFVTIPTSIIKTLDWKKGDELVFIMENGKVVLRKRGG